MIIKVARTLFFATLFYGCILDGGLKKSPPGGGTSEGAQGPINITGAQIVGTQLMVYGSNFQGVTSVQIHSNARSFKDFKVISATFNQLIAEAVDNVKIPVGVALDLILSEAGASTFGRTGDSQSSFPIEFSLQPGAVTNETIATGAVTTEKIAAGNVKLTDIAPPPITGTETHVFAWDPIAQAYFFVPYSSGGGGGGGVPFVGRGSGIKGAPNPIGGSGGLIEVETGTTGDPSLTKIPYFNNQNEIVLNGSSTPPAKLILGNTVNYSILNDGDFVIREEGPTPREILVMEANRVLINDDLYVKDKLVCVQGDPTCIPAASGITQILTTAPLTSSEASGVVTIGPGAVNTSNNLVQLDSSGKLPSIDGSQLTNIPSMVVAPYSGPNYPILSGATDKSLVPAGYKIPNTVCPSGEILKSNGADFICGTEAGATPSVTSVFGRNGVVVAAGGDYIASQVTNTAAGNIAATNVQSAINELDSEKLAIDGSGTMTGQLKTSNQNAILIGNTGVNTGEIKFEESSGANYVGFKAPSSINTDIVWTLPAAAGASGTFLTNIGGNVLSWATPAVSTATGDVVGPASSTSGNLASFNGTTGKIIQNSTIIAANVPTMAAAAASSNTVVLSNSNDKTLKTTPYTIPPTICSNGEVLKSNGTNFTCQLDLNGVSSFNGRFGDVSPVAGDYPASMIPNTASGTISATNAQDAINELNAEKLSLTGGTMTGTLKTSSQNALQLNPFTGQTGEIRFEDLTNDGLGYVGFKAPNDVASGIIWTLPSVPGATGQVLTVVGTNTLDWTTVSGGGGIGDVVGPGGALDNRLASFNGATGKLIKDSGLLTADIPTMATNSSANNQIILSVNGSKQLVTTNYSVPPTIGSATYVLKSNGSSVDWQPDSGGTGDVKGFGTSTVGNIAIYNSGDGKEIKDSGISNGVIAKMPTGTMISNELILSNGFGTELKSAGYTMPPSIGPATYVLKSDGTKVDWAIDNGGVTGTGTINNLVRWNGPSSIKDSGILISDTNDISGVAGFTSTGNMTVGTNALFFDSTNKKLGIGNAAPVQTLDVTGTAAISGNTTIGGTLGISGQTTFNVGGTPSTFPTGQGSDGQVLSTNGAGVLSWSTPAASTATGDVVGPASSTTDAIPTFSGIDGKTLKNSPFKVIDDVPGNVTGDYIIGGNAVMGENRGAGVGMGCFSHKDWQNSYGYQGFCQDAGGNSSINTGPGLTVDLKVGGNVQFIVGGSTTTNQNDLVNNGNLTNSGNLTLGGSLIINNATNSSAFPTDRGIAGQALTTNGSGTLSWGTPSASLNVQTGTSYTLANSDCGNVVSISNAGPITLTLAALYDGCVINVVQGGAGVITVVTGGGMNPRNAFGLYRTRTQYSVISIQVMSPSDAVISGDAN